MSLKVVFTYEDSMANHGSVRLRAFQVAQAVGKLTPVEIKPLSACKHEKNTLIILVKPRHHNKFKSLLGSNNIIILDILDTIDTLEAPDSFLTKLFAKSKEKLLKEVDGAIFCSNKTKKAYRHLFKHPEICTTIYHHWDGRFTNRPNSTLKQVKIAYFGLPRKAHLSDKLTGVDIHQAISYKEMSETLFPNYNAHYVVKPGEYFYHYEPLTKIATAAFAKSPVISRCGHETELLTDDYPYYIKSDTEADVLSTMDKMRNTYLDKEWNDALSIMEDIYEKASLETTTHEYVKFINQLSKT